MVASVTDAICSANSDGMLTTDCAGACGKYEPCIIHKSNSLCERSADKDRGGSCKKSAASPCVFECFPMTDSSDGQYSNFRFVLTKDNELHPTLPTHTSSIAWDVGVLELSPTTTKLFLVHGTNYVDSYYTENLGTAWSTPTQTVMRHGFVANQTQLREVTLANFLLRQAGEELRVTKFLPTSLTSLELSNHQFTHVPRDMRMLADLETLRMTRNGLTYFDDVSLKKLTMLDLSRNSLYSLDDLELPNLETLDLSNNKFTEFPTAVYKLENLKTLNMSHNTLCPTVTKEQLAKLQAIPTVDVTNNDQAPSCKCEASYASTTWSSIKVCLKDQPLRPLATPTPTPSRTAWTFDPVDSKSSSTLSSGSPTALIVVISVIIVGFLCFLGYLWRFVNKKFLETTEAATKARAERTTSGM